MKMNFLLPLCSTVVLVIAAVLLSVNTDKTSASRGGRADQYKLDASHTGVVFRIKHMGLSYTYGRFDKVAGSFNVDTSDAHSSSFNFTVDTASVNTNHKKRDDHLRSPDFFSAREYPKIKFVSTHINKAKDGLKIDGNMTLHGVTKPVSFVMTELGQKKDPWGKYRIGFATQFKIKRSQFGMNKMLDNVDDEVELMISFEGVRM